MASPAVTFRMYQPQDRAFVVDLVAETALANPWWLPTADTSDRASVEAWFDNKAPERRWLALCGTEVVGHCGLHDGISLLVADVLACEVSAPGWSELCRLVVHEDFRRAGVGRRLALLAHTDALSRGEQTWITCVAGSGPHRFWNDCGWKDAGAVVFPTEVDDRPGVCCTRGSREERSADRCA